MRSQPQTQDFSSSFAQLDPEKLGLPDELISVWLNVGEWQETKDRSWAMHRTQANSGAFMAQIPEELRRKWRGYECYQLAASRVGPDVPGENDLFARV
jgi:N-acetyl-1-D-myo-inositol-2-amino-2-deoxy-alpha-D-glucopyranoside deacetylase